MSAISSSGSSGPNMFRNIITGVITTVVGAITVYFLGFHNKGESESSADYLVLKDATINGWDAYVSIENIFQKNFQVLAQGYTEEGFSRYKEETLREKQKFNNDLKKIMETRDLDPIFISLLKRRLNSSEQMDEKYKIHLGKYEAILQTTSDPQLKSQKINEELSRYGRDVGDLNLRFKNEIEEATKILSSKYGRPFAINELMMFQQVSNNTNTNNNTGRNGNNNGGNAQIDEKMLVGTWQMTTNNSTIGTLYQYENGKMYYYFYNGDS